MLGVGAEAAAADAHRLAVGRVIAEHAAGHRRRPLLAFAQQHHGAVEADGQHVVVVGQGLVEAAEFEIGAEAANAGGNDLVALGMLADLAGQGQEAQPDVEIDVGGGQALGNRHPLGLFLDRLGLLLALGRSFDRRRRRGRRIGGAELDVGAVRAAAHRHRQAGHRVGAEQARAFQGFRGVVAIAVGHRQRPGVAAFGIARAADEGAVAAELEPEPAAAAGGAGAGVGAADGFGGEEMAAQRGVEGVDHLGDGEVLGAVDGGVEGGPERAQHRLPIDAAARNVVELVFQIGGEIVLDVSLEKALEEGGDQPAAVLGHEALLVQAYVRPVLQDL